MFSYAKKKSLKQLFKPQSTDVPTVIKLFKKTLKTKNYFEINEILCKYITDTLY